MAYSTMQKRKREEVEVQPFDVLVHDDGRRQYTRPDGWFWTEYSDGSFQLKSLPAGKYFFGDASSCSEVVNDLADDRSICAVRVNTDGTRSVCVVLNFYSTRTYTVHVNGVPTPFHTDKLVFVSEDLTTEECTLFASSVHVYMNEGLGIFGIKSGDMRISYPM
jgi:hypothetical protein